VADFDLPRGAVSIEALMAMPRERWEHLRSEINMRRRDEPARPLARCRLCEGGVFIRAQAVEGDHIPFYAHFPESPANCPWYEGGTLTPDDARAAQYQGHQESALHRHLCQTIEALAKADPRCVASAIDTYLRPAIHKRGRWPDVFLDMGKLGRFALEVQLSKPFAPEIAARHLHYEREGVRLIWIFGELEDPLPQGFHDVVTMQRGNAFVFDEDAQAASVARGVLVLKCSLEDGKGGWLKPRLVGLDDLETASGRSVFLEDRRSERLAAYCRDVRNRWWKALQQAQRDRPNSPFYSEWFAPAWASVRAHVPALSGWKEDYWATRADKGQAHLAALFAIFCSIAHSAEQGSETLYITRHSGDGALLAMLNSKLSSAEFAPYADLLEAFLRTTPLANLLDRPSLQKILSNARAGHVQISAGHPVWNAVARLFPEALDNVVRAEMMDLVQLPTWACRLDVAA
jgi:hypothetical protein